MWLEVLFNQCPPEVHDSLITSADAWYLSWMLCQACTADIVTICLQSGPIFDCVAIKMNVDCFGCMLRITSLLPCPKMTRLCAKKWIHCYHKMDVNTLKAQSWCYSAFSHRERITCKDQKQHNTSILPTNIASKA